MSCQRSQSQPSPLPNDSPVRVTPALVVKYGTLVDMSTSIGHLPRPDATQHPEPPYTCWGHPSCRVCQLQHGEE